ncbi:hypothetical protein D9M68_953320 [compost metagenome]
MAAWNRRSPFHCRASISAAVAGNAAGAVPGISQGDNAARSPEANRVLLVCSTRRLCSEWNTWCTVVRPMFSLTRPSPAM